jgi:hypothetical protein
MANIFDDNEGKRFINAGQHAFATVTGMTDNYYLMIKDFSWWIQNEKEIYAWMEKNFPNGRMHHEGMILSIPKEEQVTAFLLRWG